MPLPCVGGDRTMDRTRLTRSGRFARLRMVAVYSDYLFSTALHYTHMYMDTCSWVLYILIRNKIPQSGQSPETWPGAVVSPFASVVHLLARRATCIRGHGVKVSIQLSSEKPRPSTLGSPLLAYRTAYSFFERSFRVHIRSTSGFPGPGAKAERRRAGPLG